MGTDLMIQDPGGVQLAMARKPQEVLAEAKHACTALLEVISQKKDPVMFNGEQYLELEDWQTVARFYGCTARIVRTQYVQYGTLQDGWPLHGFEATAECVDATGRVLGSVEAMCMTDEPKWRSKTKYEYKDVLDENGKKIWVDTPNGPRKGYYKSERVKTGEEPVPLHQIRSMAQTRALSKALRSVFSWIAVLGGFKPTTAEEMDDGSNYRNHHEEPPAERKEPQRRPAAESARPNKAGANAPVEGAPDMQGLFDIEGTIATVSEAKKNKRGDEFHVLNFAGREKGIFVNDSNLFAHLGIMKGKRVKLTIKTNGNYDHLYAIHRVGHLEFHDNVPVVDARADVKSESSAPPREPGDDDPGQLFDN